MENERSTQGETLAGEVEIHAGNMRHAGVLYVALSRATDFRRMKLSRMTRAELRSKLAPLPKNLILMAALGREVPLEALQDAIRDVLRNEERWDRVAQ